jgi:hypothetical protein
MSEIRRYRCNLCDFEILGNTFSIDGYTLSDKRHCADLDTRVFQHEDRPQQGIVHICVPCYHGLRELFSPTSTIGGNETSPIGDTE